MTNHEKLIKGLALVHTWRSGALPVDQTELMEILEVLLTNELARMNWQINGAINEALNDDKPPYTGERY